MITPHSNTGGFMIAWFVITACTYLLWFNRFDKVCEKHGGIVEAFRKAMEADTPDYKLSPPNFHPAAIKTIVLVFSIVAWPFMLWMVLKSYFYDYNQDLEEYFK
jgi:hypothetical protein